MALLEAAGRSSGPEEHRLRAASVAEEIVVWRLNAKSILDLVNVERIELSRVCVSIPIGKRALAFVG